MAGDRRRWGRIDVRIPAECEDAFLGRLAGECLGAESSAEADGTIRFTVYMASPRDVDFAVETLKASFEALGIDRSAAILGSGVVEDGQWVERFQSRLQPFELGRRFLVVADGPATVPAGRSAIRLVPGRAFGTGEHPTTRLCAGLLELRVRSGDTWLDLGTGTGILAVVAVRCGAEKVLARDVDPDAIEVARDVLGANDVLNRVELAEGSLDGLSAAGVDGVVCNIAAPFFLDHGKDLAEVVRPGGRVVASGFLDGDLPEVAASLGRAGIRSQGSVMDGPWRALDALRVAGSSG